MAHVYQGKHFKNTTADFGSNGFVISDMVQNCSDHLYKFHTAMPYEIVDSLCKSDGVYTRICKAESVENEPCLIS